MAVNQNDMRTVLTRSVWQSFGQAIVTYLPMSILKMAASRRISMIPESHISFQTFGF